MSFYDHLPAGKFRSGDLGLIQSSSKSIIPIEAGKKTHKIREKSSAERNFVVGLWIDAPEDNAQNLDEEFVVLNRTAFNSSYLSLRVDQTDVYEQISLLHIELCNRQGKPYYVELGKRINLADSKIECMDKDAIQANEAVGIRFDYVFPK